MRIRGRSLVAGIAITGLMVAACGSTVPQARQDAAQVTGDDGLGATADALPPGARINEKGQVVSAEGDVLGSAEEFGISTASGDARGGAATAGGGNTSASGEATASVAAEAPGVTPTTIRLGLAAGSGGAEACQTLGAECPALDGRRAWQALVDDTNRRGGIAERKVVPVYHEFNVNSDDWRREGQEACAHWTQDNAVFAALSAIESFSGEDFLACMERGGAMVVHSHSVDTKFDARVFPRYPHYVAPIAMDLNTQATVLVDGLARQKYFGKAARLGLIIFDEPYWDFATERSLIPALKRHGRQLTSIARLHSPQGIQEFAQTANDANNAVLKFKTEGITHVMMLDYNGIGAYFLMQAAEKQAYRPRYGLTSQSYGNWLAGALGGDARNQLDEARIVGWAPPADVRSEDEPGFVNSSGSKRCFGIMRRAGVRFEDREAERQLLEACDAMWVTKAIIEAGGTTITGDSFISGIDRLGSRFVPAATFVTRISADIRDGAGAVAPLSFSGECTCFRYSAPPYGIPN